MAIKRRFWNAIITCSGNIATVQNIISNYELTLSFDVLGPHFLIQQCKSTHLFYYFLLLDRRNIDESSVVVKIPWKKHCDDEIKFLALKNLQSNNCSVEWENVGGKVILSRINVEFALGLDDIEFVKILKKDNGVKQVDRPPCFIDCTENSLFIVEGLCLFEISENEGNEFKSQSIPLARTGIARVVDFACGKNHCVLLDSDGLIYTMGSASRGQLGHYCPDACVVETTLKIVEHLVGLRIKCIAVGGWHTLALTEFGDIYGWGWNADNQLALDKYKVTVIDEPNLIQLNEQNDLIIYQIACGNRFSVILTETDEIFVFGHLKNDFRSNMLQMDILEENYWKVNYNKDQSKVVDLAASSWSLTLRYS